MRDQILTDEGLGRLEQRRVLPQRVDLGRHENATPRGRVQRGQLRTQHVPPLVETLVLGRIGDDPGFDPRVGQSVDRVLEHTLDELECFGVDDATTDQEPVSLVRRDFFPRQHLFTVLLGQ
ncbi:MAG: hypothetical protein Q8K63_11565 [Acidimicrobiales bacterium]|nr:hypothetical protein [Acidimicrobiales bacterium]